MKRGFASSVVFSMKSLVFLCTLIPGIQMAHGQSWNTMANWIVRYGWKDIACMGHPNDEVVSHYVQFDDDAVYVNIVFHDCIPFFGIEDYTCKYEVRRGSKSGVIFFRSIAVPEEGYKLYPSFKWWNDNCFDENTCIDWKNSPLSRLYGNREWYELSLGQKAAATLFNKFLQYDKD